MANQPNNHNREIERRPVIYIGDVCFRNWLSIPKYNETDLPSNPPEGTVVRDTDRGVVAW